MRSIIYVTGTRADFGLLQRTLRLVHQSARLNIALCVTGMHLSRRFGYTVREIERSGLRIAGRVPVPVMGRSGGEMADNVGRMLLGLSKVFQRERPSLILLLGDRGEMLAGALAALYLNIPSVHIHGGERSGTVDEPVRHAISKLAHYHFTATPQARKRLVRMGERREHVFVTGAPGLDGIKELATLTREELCAGKGFEPWKKVVILLFHPVVQEVEEVGLQIQRIMDAVLSLSLQVLVGLPNADAGGEEIRRILFGFANNPRVCITQHMERPEFLSWLAQADALVGNSSCGVIEAASFGLPVINVGNRQRHRERNNNVVDVPIRKGEIVRALRRALRMGRYPCRNVYGDGQAGERIVYLLETLPLTPELLQKTNVY